jgi:hypothetical protein
VPGFHELTSAKREDDFFGGLKVIAVRRARMLRAFSIGKRWSQGFRDLIFCRSYTAVAAKHTFAREIKKQRLYAQDQAHPGAR